jgi:branched-chain amino acid transport system ATP-binding protein
MLRLEDVEVGYGPLIVVRGVSLHAEAGEIVAIIGANGAGKTTLLRAISGLLPLARGRVLLDGVDTARVPAHRRVQLGIAQVPEGRQVFAELSVRDNLDLGAFSWTRRRSRMRDDIERVYELFPILRERTDQAAGTLSGGQQQMLAIGRALMARPRLLLLDEPSLGLAPTIVQSIFEAIRQLRQQHLAVVLVEQNVRAALAMADRAYVLETGRVMAEGAAAALARDERVQRSYLGLGAA